MTAARASNQPVAQPSEGSERARWRGFCIACRQVFGMPDYERYLAHAATLHPGAPVLTRGEYFEQAIQRRYGGGGARCC